MSGSDARVIGPYRIVQSKASAPSIPPEQKGARFISGHLQGRTAAFSSVFDDDQLTFSLGYRKEDGALVHVQSFVFKRRATAVAPAPHDPFAALVEQ